MEFNVRLKEIRKERGFTQKNIYEILKVSPNCYASWEQGRTEPDINSLRKLCIIFDISADYLLGLENEDGTKYVNSFNNSFNGNNSNITIK